ncbi:cytochrome c-type biogenesis CcmF C-terminal domain-containing protein [Arthrobacter tumbae]|uniref:cytochrome c-type biogenesis CcmF C-terminal domain-containing protein n=1 Tax=Arthrobacter tumbae TaxID=163874 RepID=UPI00195B01BD|nr:cytochrome c-type biogenesis CcmF C-terminal domain-containing protein [Arthrobacter tumbae]MBM7781627.1 cytochrome c-type biogenesis protein CcmF [Arthrobacter tumbae]
MSVIGTGLLVLSFAAALVAMLLWAAAARKRFQATRVSAGARGASYLSLVFILGAVALMEFALLQGGTGLNYPATVTEPGLPTYYRFTSLWSAMEGSLMLWLLTLAAVMVLFIARRTRSGSQDDPIASGVLCGLVAAFGLVVLIAHPFAATGELNGSPSPLLQDHPAMGIHPPLLYLGFAGLAVPFALSFAAPRDRSSSVLWARSVYAWTVGSWIPLTAGILLGAWWSYAVLGWGGYWAWDPVENASLMPWLLATALLHSIGPRTRAAGWYLWSIVLAGAAFSFVLLATFLTRSGVVQSIHAFSTSPLGPALLLILALAAGAWIINAARAGRVLRRSMSDAPLVSRQTAVLVNRILLVLITGIILLGSVVPTAMLAVTGERVSVGPPWYARTIAPLALLLLLSMALAPLLRWRQLGRAELVQALKLPAICSAAVVAITAFTTSDLWLSIASGIAGFVIADLVRRCSTPAKRSLRSIGALLAHFGFAVGAVAVVAGGQATTTEQTVLIGESLQTQGTSATLITVERFDDGRRSIAEASVLLGDGEKPLGIVEPQLRWYEQQGTVLAGPAIRSEPFRDVYVTLLNVDPSEGSAHLRLTVNPLISWLWVSGLLVVTGSAVAALPGSRRRQNSPPPEVSLKPHASKGAGS